ncbi:MAG: DUF6629 family protein [Thermoanaerobaculia bacterium]
MCFSASASFIAGTSLSGIGVATLRKVEARAEIPFALIPLLFGLQQLIEGVIWLTFAGDAPVLRQAMIYAYSGFSHVLWPIYVPFAVYLLEPIRWRRTAIAAFQVVGLAVGLSLLYFIVTRPVLAELAGKHIVYVQPHFFLFPGQIFLYLAATCIVCFFSSHRFVNLFGVVLLASFIAAYAIHAATLVSVWCFFAAILSVVVYVHLRFRRLGGFPRSPLPPAEAIG